MRKLFTFAFALFASVAMNAQNVDTSSWQEGDDVASYLNWGDYDGTWSGGKTANNNGDYSIDDMGDWWKGSKPSEWNDIDGTAAVGFYFDGKTEGPLTNLYQVVYFPAGYYTIQVQALYREGTPIDNFTNHFNKVIKKNAWLYADVLASEDPESEVVNSFQTYVRSLATSEQTEGRLYTSSDWKNDYKYDLKVKDPETGKTVTTSYYCPCCLPGAIAYFAEGKYDNYLNIILTQGAYVRLGFRKTANIAQDWLVFTNFRVIYNGEADDDALLEMANEEYETLSMSVEEVQSDIESKGYIALAAIVGDQLMSIDDVVDKSDIASVKDGIEKINTLVESANNALLVAYSLADLIESSHDMIVSTDFPGKGAFETELDRIELKASTDDPEVIDNDVNAFVVMYEELAKARADYLNTGDPDENGAKDFTSLIKYPWFVNPEYTPEIVDGNWQLTAEGWTDGMNAGAYIDVLGDRTDISSKVVLSADETVTNQWFKYVNYTSGWSPGLNLYYQGHLIGVSDGWNGGLIGTQEIRQQLVGLPKGYYSVKALLRGNSTDATNAWNENNLPPYHNIFAENSDEVRVSSLPGHTDSYRYSQHGWGEWNPDAWTEHKTGIISALDGKLLIGGQSSMIANYTGFRLLFYGENPNYSPMIREEIDAVYTMMNENLIEKYGNAFAGDTLYIVNLISSIKFPVSTKEGYESAFAITNSAKDYLQKVINAMGGYTLPSDYDALYAKYTNPDDENYVDGPTQAKILEKPIEFIADLGTAETDTYEKIAEAKEVYNAYKSYLSTFDKAVVLDEPELKVLVETQSADLKANYRDAATLKRYENDINFLVQRATIIAEGGRNASESNPVDITSLINNPDFTNSASSGWSGNTGTSNEYARGNSEVWNANPLDMYQVIKGLPAGKYELRVRALYRDARNVRDSKNQSWTSYWDDAQGDVNAWERHFAQLYAQTVTATNDTIDEFAYVESVCNGKFREPSFTKYYRNNSSDLIEGDLVIEDEKEIQTYDTIWTVSVPEDDMYDDDGEILTSWTDEGTGQVYTVVQDGPDNRYVFQDENGTPQFAWQIEDSYPFDECIKGSDGKYYYYPSSMLGAYCRFNLNPEAYCNKLQIEVPAGSDLRIGFRKNTDPKIEGDWIIFDDFQLFYLGGDLDEKPVDDAIHNIVVNTSKVSPIYNISGQRINALQKGLNIVDGKKVFVK